MPLYAIKKPLVAQKPGLGVIVQIQAPLMNAKTRKNIFVKRAKHAYLKVRYSLFDLFFNELHHIKHANLAFFMFHFPWYKIPSKF